MAPSACGVFVSATGTPQPQRRVSASRVFPGTPCNQGSYHGPVVQATPVRAGLSSFGKASGHSTPQRSGLSAWRSNSNQGVPPFSTTVSRETSCEGNNENNCEVIRTFDAVGSALRSVQAVLQVEPGDRQGQSGTEAPCKVSSKAEALDRQAAVEDIENQEPNRIKRSSKPGGSAVSPEQRTRSPDRWANRPPPGRSLRGEPLRVRGVVTSPRGNNSYLPRPEVSTTPTTPSLVPPPLEASAGTSGTEKAVGDSENQEPTWDRIKYSSRQSSSARSQGLRSPGRSSPGRSPEPKVQQPDRRPRSPGRCGPTIGEQLRARSPGRSSPDRRPRSPLPGHSQRAEPLRVRGSLPSSRGNSTAPEPTAIYADPTAGTPGIERVRRASMRGLQVNASAAAQAGAVTERIDRGRTCRGSGYGAVGPRNEKSQSPIRMRGTGRSTPVAPVGAGTAPAVAPPPAGAPAVATVPTIPTLAPLPQKPAVSVAAATASAPATARSVSVDGASTPASPGPAYSRGLTLRGQQATFIRASSLAQARLVHKEKVCAGDRSTRFNNHVQAQLDEVLQSIRPRSPTPQTTPKQGVVIHSL